MAVAGKLRQSSLRKSRPAGIRRLRLAPQKQGRIRSRMAAEKAREFQAGIPGRAQHRGPKFGRHKICFKPSPQGAFPFEAYLSIVMHKYSSMINGLADLSSRKPGPGLSEAPADRQTPVPFDKFSDGCKKKYLLDSADHGHLVWGAIAARELETCTPISCHFSRRLPYAA